MRILIIGKSNPDGLESNLKMAFLDLGHQVKLIEMYPFNFKILKFLANKIIEVSKSKTFMRQLLENRISFKLGQETSDLVLFLTPATDFFSPQLIELCKTKSKVVAAWFVDSGVNLRYASFINAPYDIVFISDLGLLQNMENFTLPRLVHLQEGHSPYNHFPIKVPPQDNIVIVGSIYPNRFVQIERLLREGFRVDVYSGNPRTLDPLREKFSKSLTINGPVFGVEKAAIFSSALCVINLQHPSAIDIANCRVFEVMACGGVLATNGNSIVSGYAELGACFQFSSDDELIEWLKMLLDNVDIALSYRKKALELSRGNSLNVRASKILSLIEYPWVEN